MRKRVMPDMTLRCRNHCGAEPDSESAFRCLFTKGKKAEQTRLNYKEEMKGEKTEREEFQSADSISEPDAGVFGWLRIRGGIPHGRSSKSA